MRRDEVNLDLRLCVRAGVLLLAAALGGCTEQPVFEEESAAAQSRLAVPRMSPPLEIAEVSGAPADWRLRDRLVQALRSHDIPADTLVSYRSAYQIRGTFSASPERAGMVEFHVVWHLHDRTRKRVGETTHRAAIPVTLLRESKDQVAEGLARASAESIASMLPANAALPLEGAWRVPQKPPPPVPGSGPRPRGMIERIAPNF
jgi:hypothetical protein